MAAIYGKQQKFFRKAYESGRHGWPETGATPDAAASPPSPEGMAAIMRFHEELVSAGVLLADGRLQPSSSGARVHFEGSSRTVVDGPFTEAKELVGGFWLWQVRSLD